MSNAEEPLCASTPKKAKFKNDSDRSYLFITTDSEDHNYSAAMSSDIHFQSSGDTSELLFVTTEDDSTVFCDSVKAFFLLTMIR